MQIASLAEVGLPFGPPPRLLALSTTPIPARMIAVWCLVSCCMISWEMGVCRRCVRGLDQAYRRKERSTLPDRHGDLVRRAPSDPHVVLRLPRVALERRGRMVVGWSWTLRPESSTFWSFGQGGLNGGLFSIVALDNLRAIPGALSRQVDSFWTCRRVSRQSPSFPGSSLFTGRQFVEPVSASVASKSGASATSSAMLS